MKPVAPVTNTVSLCLLVSVCAETPQFPRNSRLVHFGTYTFDAMVKRQSKQESPWLSMNQPELELGRLPALELRTSRDRSSPHIQLGRSASRDSIPARSPHHPQSLTGINDMDVSELVPPPP